MGYRKRTDANQQEIIDELREVGASVWSLHREGRGVTDLLVGFRNQNFLLEVKANKGTLTPAQIEWHATWRGQRAVVRNATEALKAIGAI